MKVFISGSEGMVGRNLFEHLSLDTSIEILSPKRSELDLLDYVEVEKFFSKHKPDVVIHCAGLVGGIHANMAANVEFFETNMMLGYNIVKACIQSNVENLINLGSSCMYPSGINPLNEKDLFNGKIEITNEGYGLAKLATAKYTEMCNKQFGLSYKTLIPCNLFGKWDKFDPDKSHMIPAVIRKVHVAKTNSQESCEIWNNGEGRREFMYVKDLVDFISFSIKNPSLIPTYCNVGTGVDYTINEYHQMVKEVIGYDGSFHHDLSKPAGVSRRLLDVSNVKNLGWKPSYTIKEGIRETYDFFLKNL